MVYFVWPSKDRNEISFLQLKNHDNKKNDVDRDCVDGTFTSSKDSSIPPVKLNVAKAY